jgi:putative hemolysin
MKPLHILPLVILPLAGCKTHQLSPPLEIGDHKYQIMNTGLHDPSKRDFEVDAISAAQAFCRKQGNTRVEVRFQSPKEIGFFCLDPGDTITRSPDHHQIIEVR